MYISIKLQKYLITILKFSLFLFATKSLKILLNFLES